MNGSVSDNAGTPGNVLYTQTIAGNANQSAVGTVDFFVNGKSENVNNYSAVLNGSFVASANTAYRLAIVGNINYPGVWAWTQGIGLDNTSYQAGNGANATRPGDRAFTLQGTPVPEPAFVAMSSLLTLGGGGLLLRRRKSRA